MITKHQYVSLRSTQDTLLQEITIEELIDTVYSNEAFEDEIRIKKVFDELLKARIKEAKIELKDNMNFIINQLNKIKE